MVLLRCWQRGNHWWIEKECLVLSTRQFEARKNEKKRRRVVKKREIQNGRKKVK